MQKNNLSLRKNRNFVPVTFFATLSLCLIGLSTFAASNDLAIKVKKNADLRSETVLVDLKTETRVTAGPPSKPGQLAFGLSMLNLGQPQITTAAQSSQYDLTNSNAVGFEYSSTISLARITLTAGYDPVEQHVGAPTRLNLVPVGLFGEYVFAKDRKVMPFIGLGAMELVQFQRGTDLDSVTRADAVPVLTAGAEFVTPWDFKVHARARRIEALSASTKEWSGQIYDLGLAYSM